MQNVRIEMLRDGKWSIRQEGTIEATNDALAAQLPAYAIQYPHRLYVNDVLVAEVTKPNARRNAKVVRHDA